MGPRPTGPAVTGQLVLTARGGSPRSANGCADAAKVSGLTTNKIDVFGLAFDSATDEYAQWAEIVMPSDWDGSHVHATCYWTCATGVGAGGKTVNFAIKGGSFGDDDALDAALGDAVACADTWIADEDLHVSAASAALTLGGSPAAGEMVVFEVMRDVSEDDLAGDAQLIAVLIAYTRV